MSTELKIAQNQIMDESIKSYYEKISNSPTDLQRIILARLLLVKYSILHDFLVFQLKNYIYACCNISVGGTLSIETESKKVIFKIDTEKYYEMNGKKRIKRKKLKAVKNYDKHVKTAKTNLELWTQQLLWGPSTQVIVYVDGKNVVD